MRNLLQVAGLGCVALVIGHTVQAADLPQKAPRAAVATAPVYSWTGFYVGGGFGYGMFNLDSGVTQNGTPVSANQTLGGRGWFGTVVGGFDYQLYDRFVIGAFADGDFSDIKGHWSDPYWEESGQIKQQWAWSAGARVGYLFGPATLSYVTGGFTQARFSQANLSFFGLQPARDSLAAQTYNGWFLGGGTEIMLASLPGWSLKTEYRFADYGAKDVPIINQPSAAFAHIHPYVQTVRTELSYRFGGGPVAQPLRAFAAAAPPVYRWTGFYLGAGGGYGMFNLDSSETENGVLQSANQTLGGRGWFGTVVGGFDYQLYDRFVIGAFADGDFSDIKGHWGDMNREASGSIREQSAWTAGGRLGYLLYPDTLSFVSAGFSKAKFSSADLLDQGINIRLPQETLAAQTYSGWFIGGGLEAMIAAFPGLAMRSEYRFADYGAKDVPIFGITNRAAFAHIHPFVQTVRTELVYRFAAH